MAAIHLPHLTEHFNKYDHNPARVHGSSSASNGRRSWPARTMIYA